MKSSSALDSPSPKFEIIQHQHNPASQEKGPEGFDVYQDGQHVGYILANMNARGRMLGWYVIARDGDFILNTEKHPVKSIDLANQRLIEWLKKRLA